MWTIPASEEPSTFIAPSSSSTQSVVSGSIFYMREVGVLTEVSVTEQVLREISKFHKQCVPGSFFSAHAQVQAKQSESR